MSAADPPSRPRGVRGQFLGILVSRGLGSVLQAVALVVLARSVEAAEFGFVNVVIAAVDIVLVATGLGLSVFVPFVRARGEADAVLAVADGKADAAFGLEAIAQPYGLHFVPVVEERFDLIVDRSSWFEPPMQRLLAFCSTGEFRGQGDSLAGYDVSVTGEIRWNA